MRKLTGRKNLRVNQPDATTQRRRDLFYSGRAARSEQHASVTRMSLARLNALGNCVSKDLRRKKENMRSIVMTYPGFQTLPRGLKMLLVASESFFFREAKSPLLKPRSGHSMEELSGLYPIHVSWQKRGRPLPAVHYPVRNRAEPFNALPKSVKLRAIPACVSECSPYETAGPCTSAANGSPPATVSAPLASSMPQRRWSVNWKIGVASLHSTMLLTEGEVLKQA